MGANLTAVRADATPAGPKPSLFDEQPPLFQATETAVRAILGPMAYSAADLQMVDDHIAQGERHIQLQHALIERLKSHGLPTEQAEELLTEFEATLLQHREHRDLMVLSMASGSP
jgi:hypothetical protein